MSTTYPDGFKGRNLFYDDSFVFLKTLAAICAAIHHKNEVRSRSFLNNNNNNEQNIKPINTFNNQQTSAESLFVDLSENKNLEAIVDNIEARITLVNNYELSSGSGSDGSYYQIEIDQDFTLQLPYRALNLAASKIHFDINDQLVTVQLISIDADGRLQLQFEGTIVSTKLI